MRRRAAFFALRRCTLHFNHDSPLPCGQSRGISQLFRPPLGETSASKREHVPFTIIATNIPFFRGFKSSISLAEGKSVAGESQPLFTKLLIANRGEIACRVIRTARQMGIPTVAIYSEPDAESLHVAMADEAVCVGPAQPAASYLNMDAVMSAIRDTGAQAVHPGYGFLSENGEFVRRLEEEGVTFIGPHAGAIAAMGDKIESKRLAKEAGVCTIPGCEDVVVDDEDAVRIACSVGFPVMMKASAGGGGKGMRVAWNEKEVAQQFSVCRAEAASSFADDRIFIERFIEQPRHIEIQLLGDNHGNVLWLPERECSIQRRNQKVIEEAPSSFIDPATRKAMGEQAVALAKAVGYNSAGTVEFLVDKNKNFFFLEMNTRVQVEHPITECITGLDIVEQMIRAAAGQPLILSQERAARITGWAFESRIYCEHADHNFLPSVGRLRRYEEPSPRDEVDEIVRVDSGVVEGTQISIHYDPIIAKLVTWGLTRSDALESMRRALDHYYMEGPHHNIAFLRSVMSHPKFVAGDISTKFLPENFPNGWKEEPLEPRERKELVAIAAFTHLVSKQSAASVSPEYYATLTQPGSSLDLVVSLDGQDHPVKIIQWQHQLRGGAGQQGVDHLVFTEVELEEERILVEQTVAGGVKKGVMDLQVDGATTSCQVLGLLPRGFDIRYKGKTKRGVLVQRPQQAKLQKFMPAPVAAKQSKVVCSPMPGAVVSIAVAPGQEVLPGDEVITIEAMKLRNVLRSEVSGTVKAVFVKVGATVAADEMLIDIE